MTLFRIALDDVAARAGRTRLSLLLGARDIVDFLAHTPDAGQLGLESDDDRAACNQLRWWLRNAVATYERDLVACTY